MIHSAAQFRSSITITLIYCAVVGLLPVAFGQTTDESERVQQLEDLADLTDESLAFITDTHGARAKGMGTAFVATADDNSAITNNPAGIAQIHAPQIGFTRQLDELGLNREGLFAFVHPIGTRHAVGGSLHSTLFANSDDVEQIISVAYAWQLQTDSKIYLGLGGKMFNKDGPISLYGIAVDFGILAQPIGRNLILGFVWQNFGPDVRVRYDSQRLDPALVAVISSAPNDREIPFNLKFGLGYRFELRSIPVQITGQIDKSTLNRLARISLGTEVRFPEVLTLRTGYTSESEIGRDLSVGAEIRYNMMRVGYAYINRQHQSNRHEAYLVIDFLNPIPRPPI